jgi:hypothetical protein
MIDPTEFLKLWKLIRSIVSRYAEDNNIPGYFETVEGKVCEFGLGDRMIRLIDKFSSTVSSLDYELYEGTIAQGVMSGAKRIEQGTYMVDELPVTGEHAWYAKEASEPKFSTESLAGILAQKVTRAIKIAS